MGLFRKKARPTMETIAGFWQWWATARGEVAQAIDAGTVQGFAGELGHRVHAIHPDLQWELTRGVTSAHVLVVTAGGQDTVRAVAARWFSAAPPADDTWSYRSVRAGELSVFESTIELDGHKLDLGDMRYGVAVDMQRRQIDVVCHHPAFVNLPDDVRGQISFLTLDWALGEDEVETWIGEITWTATEPANPRTPHELRRAATALAGEEDSWVLMRGQRRDGTPLMAAAASPLRPARWPRFDLHVPIRLPYQRHNEGQLPVDESLAALRRFEDELSATIGPDGVLVAHETAGRERTLHFYVDSQSTARAELESHLPQWREGRASAGAQLDPAFEKVRHLMQ
ncbi:DUF695 domain-containing protein [Micromonospora auratinigra]|uniref:Uncharacterized protein n=1 Tax=Micromonospora auratinigra TaxID=261654 RepID=A0A1A8Z9P2_9ACTN|nr:DUF695 domain-containing protein [Micromonospora auratinigra]SBT40553.1 Family of unknown function (DUF695) [Micromonospora auratinigra]